jgi:exopolysaccharide synthesis protein ExoD
MADIDLAPAFVRHNHAVSWTAGDDTGRLHGPGFILAVMAVQLIVGRAEPVFPHVIMTRRLPTKQLRRIGGRAIHVLKYLEKVVHPRWPMTFEVARHAVGVMVLLLTVVLLVSALTLSLFSAADHVRTNSAHVFLVL